MFLKVLNLISVVLQVLLFHFVLFEQSFLDYGVDFFVKIANGANPFAVSRIFPLISFCNFNVHQNLHQVHGYTTQCLLNANIFIEKYFVVLWYWLLLLIVANVLNIGSWSVELSRTSRLTFLRKYIKIYQKMYGTRQAVSFAPEPSFTSSGADDGKPQSVEFNSELPPAPSQQLTVEHFCDEYLRSNGVLMLHMIKSVAGEIIFLDTLGVLWKDFRDTYSLKKQNPREFEHSDDGDHEHEHEQDYIEKMEMQDLGGNAFAHLLNMKKFGGDQILGPIMV
jgi:hypothetical protein